MAELKREADEFTISLCRGHHREVHRCGEEADWWERFGIDPMAVARALWLDTHPLPAAQDESLIIGTSEQAESIGGQSKLGLDNEPNYRGRQQ